MKIAIRVVLVLVVVLVVVVASSYFWLDGAARKAVETAGSRTLGVPLTLGSLDIGVLRGSASLGELNIANPEGCEKPFFFDLQAGSTQVTLKSVLEDTIEIPTLELTGLTIYIEPQQGTGKYNYDVILENIARNKEKEAEEPAPEGEGAGGKQVRIGRLAIRDIKVYYKTKVFVTTPTHVDEIVMTDVGGEGKGVDLGQLTSLILTGTLSGIANELPGAIGDGLKAGVGKLGDIGGAAVGAVGGVAEDGAKAIGEGVKGLFGGSEK